MTSTTYMPDSNVPRDTVLRQANWLEARLAALPMINGPDWTETRAAYYRAEQELALALIEGSGTVSKVTAGIRRSHDATTISMLGYRASSTGGLAAACRNWIAQVRKKAGVAA